MIWCVPRLVGRPAQAEWLKNLNKVTQPRSTTSIFTLYFTNRKSLEGLREQLESHFGKGRELNEATRKKYAEYGQSLPSETAQRLSAVEILGETLVSEMDEKVLQK